VRRLRSAVVAFAAEHGVCEPPIGDLKIAVSEAMTNVIVHAYDDRNPGTVDVSVSVDVPGREVTVVVADDGVGMNPRADSPGMGLGLPLIGNLADKLQIAPAPSGRGTEVRMRFELPEQLELHEPSQAPR
jgi:serine/threonine-protein kinase RsbW/stage II sporulation protein AB (anti-sigma F factor)